MAGSERPRVLIFIVAYNAERHIEKVLARIPATIFQDYDYEILLIDDSSSDRTFPVAKLYQSLHADLNLTVLFNPDNQGYGGNQKLGYRYAMEHRYDIVVLLHGDGQYAPELLGEMIRPIAEHRADAVIGSRFLDRGGARRGRMPLYKYVGNRILTAVQNALLGTRLSEFHSGYRAYSVAALSRIPFERNANAFHFDTQILIQLLRAGCTILETPIPTYYGDEICHVNGLAYAWNVLKTTLLSRAHTLSILYQREFDIEGDTTRDYGPKFGYASSHSYAVDAVAPNTTVLELGCNQGYVSRALKAKGCFVVGCDVAPLRDPHRVSEFHLLDLNDTSRLPESNRFDTVLLLDVLEHLARPERLLDALRATARRKKLRVVITAPNIGFFVVRLQLLLGHFNYGRQGILDLSHVRLFTFRSLRKLCLGAGYRINRIDGIPAPFPKAVGFNWVSRSLVRLNLWLIRLNRSWFSYQIYLEAEPTPVVEDLLAYALTESAARDVS